MLLTLLTTTYLKCTALQQKLSALLYEIKTPETALLLCLCSAIYEHIVRIVPSVLLQISGGAQVCK